MKPTLSADVVVIGAGIAGLWLHHRLKQQGFNSILLEKNRIGEGQTLSSQGIIHGGAKYALNGILSKATQAIGDMPARWQSCLTGQGDIDLSAVNVFTSHQLMWSTDRLSSKMLSFFASKALASRMTPVPENQRPAFFQDQQFKGSLYQLDEPVLDISSVIKALAEPYRDSIVEMPAGDISWQTDASGSSQMHFDTLDIHAQHYVFTAGEGNGELLSSLNITQPEMQLRPLQMPLCRSKNKTRPLPLLYAHSLGSGSKPIATITSHYDASGNVVWYIGGNIAEQGVGKPLAQLSTEAEQLLAKIMPWTDLPSLEWAGHSVNRAEPKQSALNRPDTAFIESVDNIHIAWPTKLALAPDLADKAISSLNKAGLRASSSEPELSSLPKAQLGQPLWDRVFS